MSHCHDEGFAPVTGERRIVLVGNPNAGKSTLFNALTGLSAKVANYPGATVSRTVGTVDGTIILEDLPGTYSLDPMSPDEKIVADVLSNNLDDSQVDAVIAVIDVTTMKRSLGLIAQLQHLEVPVLVVLSYGDELTRLGGRLDIDALERALGMTVQPVTVGDRKELAELRELIDAPSLWDNPILPAPVEPSEQDDWIDSVLKAANWRAPKQDSRSQKLDNVLLHPVWGTLIFFAWMFIFFQVVFTVAAPFQGWIEDFFNWLGGVASDNIGNPWVSSFVCSGLIGGVGGVLSFVPQIALLFLMISLMKKTGYMARAAFLMDSVMSKVGLEGRAFVAMLSALACAIPGIMATRALPNERDRLATMMTVPLMTCSARLPVYTLLISMLVPLHWQGSVMFLMYLLGALATMASSWVFTRFLKGPGTTLPFYMHMPSYRWPGAKELGRDVWDAVQNFLNRVAGIILMLSVVTWAFLNLPVATDGAMQAAGVDPSDATAAAAFQIDNSVAAIIGKFIQPIFSPLGFDWRVTVGLLGAMGAREVFVSTMGQIAAATSPESPITELAAMTWPDGSQLFTPGATAALLVYFAFALQCTSTIAALRRESGSWKWPAIAFIYMTGLGWLCGWITKLVVDAVI